MRTPASIASHITRRRASHRRRASRGPALLLGFTHGNTITHGRAINTRGLSQSLRDGMGRGEGVLDYAYTYDQNGNVATITDYTSPPYWNQSRNLQYDARDRMVSATAPGIFGEELYEYDALDNVRRLAVYPNGSGGYVLDYHYQYDGANHLTGIDDPGAVQQWAFSHTALGETLSRHGHDSTWNYQWNAAGRLTRADRSAPGNREAYPLMPIAELSALWSSGLSPDGLRGTAPSAQQATWETYVYDAHGHRTRSQRSDGSTRYQVYTRAGQLLYVEDSRNNSGDYDWQRSDFIHLNGKLIAQRGRPLTSNSQNTRYHHTDHIQSAAVETNTSGIETLRTIRMPYGSPYDGQYREGPGFAGHVTDTQTNLTYMQQRYYDPVALRFLSPDPVDVSGTDGSNFNRYWYANNNPYRFTDPDGMASCTDRADCARRLALADQARGRDGRILVGAIAATATAGAAAAGTSAAVTAIASNLPRAATVVNAAAEIAAGDALGGASLSGATALTAGTASKISHLFDNPKHGLDVLVDASGGSREKAFAGLQDAANKALANGQLVPGANEILPGGQSGAILKVNGVDVQLVGGRVNGEVVEIGSASRRFPEEK
ncbi:MAG TPA: RHS repeat-associated core domain-containing protein [Chiayiivirga sp.]|nr:RHS repeat-associated core domain-containing protein [Chiayiivirga sp.]